MHLWHCEIINLLSYYYMKKVIVPKTYEQAVYYSDFTGKCFSMLPNVELTIEFNYGSKFDGTSLKLELSDEDIMPIIDLIKSKLSEDYKFKLKSENFINNINHDDAMDSRDFSQAELYSNKLELNKILIQP
jgi:hypothetical protein